MSDPPICVQQMQTIQLALREVRFDSPKVSLFHTNRGVRRERKNVPSPFATMPPPHPQMMQSWSIAARPWDWFPRAKKRSIPVSDAHAVEPTLQGRGPVGSSLVTRWIKSEGTFFRSGREGIATRNTGAHASDIIMPVLRRPHPFAARCRRQM